MSRLNVKTSTIGDLLDHPTAKEILFKHFPAMATSEQIHMARGMTLHDIRPNAPDVLTDEALATVDTHLAQIPPKK